MSEPLQRPRVRADCAGGPRPCRWVGCRYHLATEFRGSGSPPETCALDVADRGGITLEEVGDLLGVTRERIRQIERNALNRLRETGAAALVDWTDSVSGTAATVTLPRHDDSPRPLGPARARSR